MCYKCEQDCNDTCGQNPVYEDCGCLYPNTFKCTDYTGADLVHLESRGTIDGERMFQKVDAKIGELQAESTKVAANSTDICPSYLIDKLEAGLNISLSVVGTGCDKKVKIDAVDGGVAIDIKVKASATDTTTDYLTNKVGNGKYIKKSIANPSGNEVIKFDVVPETLISIDNGNQLTLGTDGGLKTTYTAPTGAETKIIEGNGVKVDGIGTIDNPYVLSTNDSIQIARPCFDGKWKSLTLVNSSSNTVTHLAGTPQYRFRYDGTLEFRGMATYKVDFGESASLRKFTIIIANITTTCATLTEQAGTSDLKGITYLDPALTGAYGYIIRKATEKIILEFQSSYTNATTKTVVVNFEGAISHPNF